MENGEEEGRGWGLGRWDSGVRDAGEETREGREGVWQRVRARRSVMARREGVGGILVGEERLVEVGGRER